MWIRVLILGNFIFLTFFSFSQDWKSKLSDARKKNITDNVKNQKPENIYSIQKIRSEIEKFITDPEIQKGYTKNRNTELNNKYTALIQNLEQAQQQASTSTTAPASNTGATTTDNTAPVSNTGATTTDNTAPVSTTAPVSNTGRGKTPGNRGGGRSKTPGNKSRKK
jgi:asparagine N-glycosylation enzyme membrane subunit Stt3